MRRLAVVTAALVLASGCGAETPPAPSQRPVLAVQPTPDVTTSAPARTVADPSRIRIPSIGVDARIVKVGLAANGDMETPDFGHAGWYSKGPKPGEDGPAVVVAHVDSKTGPDVFARLRELKTGAEILVTDKAGKTHTFAAQRSQQVAKTALPAQEIWGPTDGPALRLITCGGAFDKTSGHYLSNVVVYASQES